MTWRIDGPEMNMVPEEFQERLTHIGGVNRFDEPNFVVWWGQYAFGPGSFKAGGVWSVDEKYYLGYRDLLRGSGEACFCLGQWHDPQEYGPPESYYVQNYDEVTGLQMLGEYPYNGRYEVLYNLRWNEMVGGKLTFYTMPLNNSVFDVVTAIVALAKDIGVEKARAAHAAALKIEEDAKLGEIERHLREKEIPFAGDAVSFTRQGIRSTLIDKKMLEMQRTWNAAARNAATLKTGLQTR